LAIFKICNNESAKFDPEFPLGGKQGSPTIAKVAWNVLIQPKSNGGLGLIDPLMQSRALLTKFVIRGLLPRSESWKELFLN
jgi:hypothetical protein